MFWVGAQSGFVLSRSANGEPNKENKKKTIESLLSANVWLRREKLQISFCF